MAPGGFYNLWGYQTLDDQLCTGSGCLVNVEDWDKATTILFEVQETGAPPPQHPNPGTHMHTHTPALNQFCLPSRSLNDSSQHRPCLWSLSSLKPSRYFKIPLTCMSSFFSLVPHEKNEIVLMPMKEILMLDIIRIIHKNNTLNIWGHVLWVLLDWKT